MVGAVVTLAVLGTAAASLGAYGHRRQRALARRAFAELHATARAPKSNRARLSDEVPSVVRRWLARAVPEGSPVPRAVSVEQDGLFRMKPGQPGADMKAHQEYTLEPPGFVWDARIRIGALPFYGLDSLIGERAVFSGRLFGLVQVAGAADREVLRGSMLRFLGELPWLPQAVLALEGLRWETVDDTHARASLTLGEETVSGVFEFDEAARPVRFSTERSRALDGGGSELTTWVGEYRDHARVAGVEVPSSAQVSWMLPEGPYTYWEADLRDLRFLP